MSSEPRIQYKYKTRRENVDSVFFQKQIVIFKVIKLIMKIIKKNLLDVFDKLCEWYGCVHEYVLVQVWSPLDEGLQFVPQCGFIFKSLRHDVLLLLEAKKSVLRPVKRRELTSSTNCTKLVHSVGLVDVADINDRATMLGEQHVALSSVITISSRGN